MNPIILVGIGLGLGIILIFIGLSVALSRGGQNIEARLQSIAYPEEKGRDVKEREKGPSVLARGIDKVISGRGFTQRTATELARADIKLTVGEFLILRITSILGTGLIVGLIWGHVLFGIGGAVLGFFLPNWYVAFRQGRRLQAFNNQLSDAINLMANGLRSGYSLLQSMESLSSELPPPMSEEFRRVVLEVGLGLTPEQALNNLLRRVPSDDLDLMITAINVQHEVGGNLAEILETIGHTIRERVRIKGEIATLTAQGRISGYVVSFLPIGLGALLYLMNRDYIGSMFSDTCGIIMMAAGLVSMIIGFLAIRKIVNIEV
jgi:tight adherence protein B